MKHKFKSTGFEKKIFAFLTLFGFISIVLKLFDVIDYSWYLVTLPFWALWAFLLGVIAFAIFAGIVVHSYKTLIK